MSAPECSHLPLSDLRVDIDEEKKQHDDPDALLVDDDQLGAWRQARRPEPQPEAQQQQQQPADPIQAPGQQPDESIQLSIRSERDEGREDEGEDDDPSAAPGGHDAAQLLRLVLLGQSRIIDNTMASNPMVRQAENSLDQYGVDEQLGDRDILQPLRDQRSGSGSSSSSSSAVVPLSPLPPNVWRSVPTDALGIIASHLDGRSLARMAGVDQQSRKVTTQTAVWFQLLLRPPYLYIVFAWRETIRERRLTQPADVYAQLYLHALQLKRHAEHRSLRQQSDILAFRRSWPAFVLFDVLELPLLVGLLLLGVVLASVELHRNDGAVTFWSMWPFPAACAWSLVALLFALWQKHRFQGFVDQLSRPPQPQQPIVWRILPLQYHDRSMSLARSVVESSERAFVPVLLAMFLFTLFVALRVTGSADLSWWSMSAPFYTACGLWLLVVVECTGWMGHINRAQMCGVWLGVVMPLLAFSLLLPVKLSSPSRLSLAVVFVPLWFLDLLLIGGAVLLLCVYLCTHQPEADQEAGPSWEFPLVAFLSLIFALCLLTPFLVFKVLLCVYFDPSHSSLSGSLGYPSLFAPLYVFFGAAFGVALVCASLAWKPDQWKHGNDRGQELR